MTATIKAVKLRPGTNGKLGTNGKPAAQVKRTGPIEGPTVAAPFANVEHDQPVPGATLAGNLAALTGGWPVSLGRDRGDGGTLITGDGGELRVLPDQDTFFAWVGNFTPVAWSRKGSSKGEFFAGLKSQWTTNYGWATDTPHYPWPLGNVLYPRACVPPKKTGALDKLISRFAPATDADRLLLKAMVLTFYWDGPPGRRPPFLLTAPDNADGSGTGKTTAAELLAQLVGGHVLVDSADRKRIIEAVLAPSAMWQRVVLLDNIDSDRFGSDRIEGLITTTSIDGHRLTKGRAVRPNYMTWVMTANDPAFGHDTAGRVVPVTLDRPKTTSRWFEETVRMIRDRREAVEADVAWTFSRPATTPLGDQGRWPEWATQVLGRCDPHPSKLLALIAARRRAIDADVTEGNAVVEIIKANLQGAYPKSDLDRMNVFIPTLEATAWLRAEYPSDRTGQLQRKLHKARCDRLLTKQHTKTSRGVVWTGKLAEGEPTTYRHYRAKRGQEG